MGAAAIPLVLSAIGTGVSVYNQNQATKSADENAANGIRLQAADQQKADQQVGNTVDALGKSSPEASRSKATDAFMEQLNRSRGQAIGKGIAGGSSRYNADNAGAQTDVADYGARAADVMARMNAPALQRQEENVGVGRLASNLGAIGRDSSADQFLTELRGRSIRPNPWVDAAGSLISGVGSGMASRNPSPKKPPSVTGTRFVDPTVDTRGLS